MEKFDCVVDTTELAKSVEIISKKVNDTTLAVTNMHKAVIETEKNATDYICANVDRGFYSLIKSQISAKLADNYSKLNAKFTLLIEYSKTLGNTKNRMEADVNRLKRDYYKIFHGLDKALENRIYQLDKPAMLLANTRQNLIVNKTIKNITTSFYSDKDVTQTSSLALTARMKTKAGIALDCLYTDIYENTIFQNSIASNLSQDSINENMEVCVPVVYSLASSQVMQGTNISKIFVPEGLDQQLASAITTTVESQLNDIVNNPNSDLTIVKNTFEEMVAQSNVSQDVAKLMMVLFDNGGAK